MRVDYAYLALQVEILSGIVGDRPWVVPAPRAPTRVEYPVGIETTRGLFE